MTLLGLINISLDGSDGLVIMDAIPQNIRLMFFKYTELFEEYFYLCVLVREVFLHVLDKKC